MKNCAILVLSCDKYSDLWKPFFHQFWKFWPDCKYPIYLGSNTISYDKDKRVKTILSGPDKDWSTSLLAILKNIPEEFIFIWLDDIFLISKTDNEVWASCWNLLKDRANHIFTVPLPQAKNCKNHDQFGIFEQGEPYRTSVRGFWRKSSLFSLLLPGETPWNFEIMGSYRCSYSEGFFYLNNPLFSALHVVEKGKIFPEAATYCKKEHIPLNISFREVMKGTSYFKSIIKSIIYNTVVKIHWKKRVHLMSNLRRLLVSY